MRWFVLPVEAPIQGWELSFTLPPASLSDTAIFVLVDLLIRSLLLTRRYGVVFVFIDGAKE